MSEKALKLKEFIERSKNKGFTDEALMVMYEKVKEEREEIDIQEFNYEEWYEKEGDIWVSNDYLYVLSHTTLFRKV